jgi:hypothetical protein
LLYISSNTQNKFLDQCILIINNVEIIACKLELFKHPIINFIKRSAQKGRDQLQLCLRHKQTNLRSMPIWNPVSEYQCSIAALPVICTMFSYVAQLIAAAALTSGAISEDTAVIDAAAPDSGMMSHTTAVPLAL